MDSWIIWIVGISIAYWIGHAVGGHMKAYQMMQNMINNPDGVIELVKKLKIKRADTKEPQRFIVFLFLSVSTLLHVRLHTSLCACGAADHGNLGRRRLSS